MKPKRQHGAVATEFALIAPLLFLMILGIAQFGWLFNNYVILTHAAALGARLLASERGYATPYTDTQNAVLAATASLGGTPAITLKIGATACSSDTACASALGTATQPPPSGTQASVSISYAFAPLFNGALYSLAAMMPSTLSSAMSDYVQ